MSDQLHKIANRVVAILLQHENRPYLAGKPPRWYYNEILMDLGAIMGERVIINELKRRKKELICAINYVNSPTSS